MPTLYLRLKIYLIQVKYTTTRNTYRNVMYSLNKVI